MIKVSETKKGFINVSFRSAGHRSDAFFYAFLLMTVFLLKQTI
ncbi:hypothetical protein NY10_715 [Carnobacterium antarcticum]|nr:hypothetical protein NY10_715 [Carnobacterium sp. CP1]